MSTSAYAAATTAAAAGVYSQSEHSVPLGYLRAFLTFLVVAHHAALAYFPFPLPVAKSLSAGPYLWPAFPILDPIAKWQFGAVLTAFNDIFFMSLMFLISGIFTWPSLVRKGSGRFLSERVRRIGLPYVVSAAILAPLAYYPTYLAGDRSGSFWQQWFAIPFWPAGPAWFLWVLLAFGIVISGVYKVSPRLVERLARMEGSLRPIGYFGVLLFISTLTYVPMAARFTPEHWMTIGPFSLQISRLLHYFSYFAMGMSLGSYGIADGLLSSTGKLARRWPLWVVTACVSFVASMAIALTILGSLSTGGPTAVIRYAGYFAWPVACASISLACLSLFLRFAQRPNRLMDSLSANAYGIYIFHYFCVTWMQYALLSQTTLPGWAKGCFVAISATVVSWALAAAVRRTAVLTKMNVTG